MDVTKYTHWLSKLALVLALTLSGCARLPAPTGKMTTNAAAPLPTWNIGIIGAALGPGGIEGSYSGDGAQLAIEHINSGGGVFWQGHHYRLGRVISGNGAVLDRVRDILTHTPPSVALLGPDESDAAVAALPLLASVRIPVLTLATAPELTDPTQNQGATILRVRPSLTAWARILANYAMRQGGGPIALAVVDDAYGHAGTAAMLATGLRLAAQVTLPLGMADATGAAAALMSAHATTVICWDTQPETALLLRTLRAAGWNGRFLVSVADADFIALAGSDSDGIIGETSWSPDEVDSASQHFTAAYQRRFGSLPDAHSAALYDAVQIIAAALAQVGPDPAALSAYLMALPNTPGIAGTYRGTPTGDLMAAPQLVQIQGGQTLALTP